MNTEKGTIPASPGKGLPGDIAPVRRERLDQLLENAVKNPVVIVSAGSGHGKTHAVSSYFAQVDEYVVWLRLTQLENYTVRFWELFLEAVSAWSPALSQTLREDPFPDSLPAMHRFLELFAEEACRCERRIILVFDDYQLLEEGAVREFISCIAQVGLENVSVILIAGADVNISLSGSLHPVRLTDSQLRFTREEIRVYYTALGIHLSEDGLERIYALTEGWAFAVYLLGRRLKKNALLSPLDIEAGVFDLFRLMEQEFYEPLDHSSRQALTLLSLLEDFPLDLARTATRLNAEALESLISSNSLVSYRPETASYYFHTLFRQFLEEKQALLKKKVRDGFLERVAGWYEGKGLPLRAVRHYLSCNHYGDAGRILLGQCGGLLTKDAAGVFLQLAEQLPEGFMDLHPMLWIAKAHLMFSAGLLEDTERLLRRLYHELLVESPLEEQQSALGEACILLAFISLHYGTYDFVRLLDQARTLLPDGSTIIRPGERLMVGNGNAIPFSGSTGGNLERMEAAMFQVMPWAEQLLHGFGAGRSHLAAAEAAYYRGDLKRAEELLCEALPRAAGHCQWDIVCNCYYLQMRAGLAHGSLDQVEAGLEKLRRYATQVTAGTYFTLPEIAESGFFLKIGLKARVARWVTDDTLPQGSSMPFGEGRELVMKAGYLVADHRYYEALAFIESGISHCRESGQWFSGLKLQILKALTYDSLEEYGVAAKSLETAWRVAEESGAIMPFVEYGALMRSLINHVMACKSVTTAIPSQWIEQILIKSATYAKRHAIVAKEYYRRHGVQPARLDSLTDREREVLRLLCQGLTNEEISEKLGVHTNTVKGTLQRIYPKIHAVNRADAVRIVMAELV